MDKPKDYVVQMEDKSGVTKYFLVGKESDIERARARGERWAKEWGSKVVGVGELEILP